MTRNATKDELRGKPSAEGQPEPNRQRRAADGEVLYVLLEVQRLTEAVREGRLSERVKDQQLSGTAQQMMVAINELLDAILLRSGA